MSPEQYLQAIGSIDALLDHLLSQAEVVEWTGPDQQLDAWDILERLQRDIGVIVRQQGIDIAAKVPPEYLHPRAGVVHTEVEKTEAWDGHGVLEALTETLVDAPSGEWVPAIRTEVLAKVLPAVEEGRTSSRWKITGLRAAGVDPDSYREVKWGDRVLRRGPRWSRPQKPWGPMEKLPEGVGSGASTLEESPPLPEEEVPPTGGIGG